MKMPHRLLLPVVAAMLLVAACDSPGDGEPTSHAQENTGEFERGPHRGRLLRDGSLALELQIFEEGVPPEFHVYLFRDGEPLPPTGATVTVELHRLDGQVDRIAFEPRDDYLRGDTVVAEPHSFSVAVNAMLDGTAHTWRFDSFEGRTTIPAATAAAAGVRTAIAGPARIADVMSLRGRVVPDPERVRSVAARFPGPIRRVLKSVGDTVQAGEALAIVESNESLTDYEVTAPIGGMLIERRASAGEVAAGEPLFVVADYRSLWAELNLFPRDLARVKPGMEVRLRAADGDLEAQGTIARITPSLEEGAPPGVQVARVRLENSAGTWVPGLFVQGDVTIASEEVPLAVRRSGLQAFRDFTVVFAQVGETYEVRMLELGRQDATWVEVIDGLKPGTPYVVDNSYLIKADIEKSGASHDH